jgi:4-amino-4-deoxy-L-arabinose transferase-like glycosyltransferase
MSTTVTVSHPEREPHPDAAPMARPDRQTWWRRPGRPAWALPALGAVLLLAAGLYTWDLSSNGMANTFYAAAVKSGTESWKAFLFGSIDPGSFITVDKPPASLWVMELSGRIFGFSSWSMLLPEALAGVGSVYLLHRTVRKWTGEMAAVLAALALALTPVATLMFRINDPDAFLTFLLVASAAALWAALESGRTRWLVLCGSLVGLAFITKMLEAFSSCPPSASSTSCAPTHPSGVGSSSCSGRPSPSWCRLAGGWPWSSCGRRDRGRTSGGAPTTPS